MEFGKGLCWGENLSLWTPKDIVTGATPQSLVVDLYDAIPFEFEPDLINDFLTFVNTTDLGVDLPKYMLTRYSLDTDHLSVQVKKTFWRYCQFVWKRYAGQERAEEKRNLWHKQIIREHLCDGDHRVFYPNSFCLHLIIETPNGNVLVTETSKKKSNDYPSRKSVTLGEQLELSDIIGQKGCPQDVVTEWTKRAVFEEFGISETSFSDEFVDGSLKILSLDMEMDIFNFALVCVIKLNKGCEQFKKDVEASLDKNEISNIMELPLDDIPGILMGYPVNKDEYHPSAFLQLLLFYLHKKGFDGLEELKNPL